MRKIILTGSIANSLEWYDFALYANFASLIGQKFFPSSDPNLAIIAAFGVFAIGFLMRPIGAMIFGAIGDRLGRKQALSLAILAMAIPTAMVGILPTYEVIGISAPILLTLIRLLQGLSMGGALMGSASYIIEHAPAKNRGVVGSATMFTLCLGFTLGSVVAWALSTYMSHDNFMNYGWRLPFLFGIVIVLVSYYIKRHSVESPEFEEEKISGRLVAHPFKELMKSYKHVVLTSISINSLGSVGFYALAVFVSEYLQSARNISFSAANSMSSWSMIVIMFSVVFAGAMSDYIGRKRWFILTSIVTMIFIWPFCKILMTGEYSELFFAQVGFAFLVGCYIGPEPALQMEMYPTNVRNTGVGVSYNVGCAVFGGAAPLICKLLFDYFGNIYVLAYYISGVALLSIIAVSFYKNRWSTRPSIKFNPEKL
jgi:MHS family proline/betaine transporter-like MFS transporter